MKTDPRKLLENVRVDRRDLHKNVLALRIIVSEREAGLITLLQATQNTPLEPKSTGGPFDVSRAVAVIKGMLYENGADYASAKAALELAENSSAFKEASDEIEPLLAAIAILDADAENLRLEKARMKAEVDAAIEAAKKRALAAAENDPVVLKAKKQLQSLDAEL